MLRQKQDENTPEAPSLGDRLGNPLATYFVEKEIHNHLCSLERHLDAYLIIERLKARLKSAPEKENGTDHQQTELSGGLSASYVDEMIDNDPEFVETAFRRHIVEEIYKDMDRIECISRLDTPAPQTEELIQELRERVQRNHSNKASDIQDKAKNNAAAGTTECMKKHASLLSRVMRATHPLLQSHDPGPWKEVVNDGEKLKIHLRHYKDNPQKLSFRLEGIVSAPLICILSVLNEVDYFSNWVPYFTTPFKLGLRKVDNERLGRVHQVVQFHVDFPWPFANRDACFEVFAVDDFERNSHILVKMITLDQKYKTPRQNMTIPATDRKVERICVDGSLVIKPLGPNASLLSLLWHENCGMRIPVLMVDFVTKLFARSAFEAFRRTCESARTGELEERRKQNSDLYGFIMDRLAEVGLTMPSPSTLVSTGNLTGEVQGSEEADTDDDTRSQQ